MILLYIITVSPCYLKNLSIYQKNIVIEKNCVDIAIDRFQPLPNQIFVSDQNVINAKIKLVKLKNLYQNIFPPKQVQIEPVILWAQNLSYVFFTFKLSHRWDSPPCQDIRNQKIEYQNNSRIIRTEIICVMSQTRLYDQIENISIKKEAFQYVAKVNKKQNNLWKYLQTGENKYGLWRQVASKYRQDMDAWQQLMEQRKQKKKKKKSKIKFYKFHEDLIQTKDNKDQEKKQNDKQNIIYDDQNPKNIQEQQNRTNKMQQNNLQNNSQLQYSDEDDL